MLLLLSRPARVGELFAVAVTGLLCASLLTGSVSLGPALARTGAVGVAVGFGVLSWRSSWSVLARGAAALGTTLAALVTWCLLRGVGWAQVEASFASALAATYQGLLDLYTDPASRQRLTELLGPGTESAPRLARILPSILALSALAGTAMAALWQHRLAGSPVGRPPARFRSFRFNDQLIWGAIFSLALLLAPLPPDGRILATNLVVFGAGLYGVRGLAVVVALLAPAPVLFRVLVGVLSILAIPIAAGACLVVGLADTWLDFRRRLVPSTSQGVSS